MNEEGQRQKIEFNIDKNELYREENFTDLKVGAIRRLTPIKTDGTDDKGRKEIFIGNSQLMSPEGPLPIQVKIEADTFEEALDAFPSAMQQGLAELVQEYNKSRQKQQAGKEDDSRIIMP